jgi:hypothetical protein
MQHAHFFGGGGDNILEQWLLTYVPKCAAAHYDHNTFTPRHTLYPTRGILPSSRRKSDIPF